MKRVNSVLLVVFAVSAAANFAIHREASRPNREFLPEMVHSVAYDAFAPNPNFPDGKTLQPPPAGAIPRGFRPRHYQATPEDALRAGEELTSPPANDEAALERGAFVFQTFCTPCHGGSAKGDGAVALRGYPPPPPLMAEKAVKLKDGQMFHILTYGQKNMPSYAGQLSEEDRWRVIAYVRSLQRSGQK